MQTKIKKMQIPFFSLERQCQEEKQNWTQALETIFNEQTFIGGKPVETFETALGHYLKNAKIVGCNSGTDALWLALAALNIEPNNIILTTPFSFIASSSEIVAHQAIPLFIDIDPETFCISPEKTAAWLASECEVINQKTVHKSSGFFVKGILAVNLFGQLANYQALRKIAEEWHLWIIEDACQSIGATIHNQQAGTFGDIGTFSFYPTKNLGAYGDAGCMITKDEQLNKRLIRLKNHGRAQNYEYEELGINSRLDGIQAAVLTEKLKTLDLKNAQRKAHAEQYFQGLKDLPFLQLPTEKHGTHTFHQYSVLLKDQTTPEKRDLFAQLLEEEGIQTRVFYPKPLNEISFLQTNKIKNNECPIARQTCNSIISLPIWPELRKNEIDFVIHGIIKTVEKIFTPQLYSAHDAAEKQL